MGAPTKNMSDGIDGAELPRRTGVGRSRSSNGSESMSLSPSSNILRASGNRSQSPAGPNQQTLSRSNSLSKKEQAKEKGSSRSKSRENPQVGSSANSKPRNSSKDRKSYLSQRATEKKESEGRKTSVLGSLNTFLDENNKTPRHRGTNRDAQSVLSAASSRRRRRSHTPSSASVIGGVSMTREELRLQRRSRSSSAGPLDRVMEDRKKSRSNRDKHSSKEPRSRESSRRRDRNKDSSERRENVQRAGDASKPSSSKRKESSKNRSRSASVSKRGDEKLRSHTRTPTKSRSSNSVKPSSTEPSNTEPTVHATGNAEEQPTLKNGNGAEVPPGFPIAAVDGRVSGQGETSHDNDTASTVLDSTIRLRQRQAGIEENTRSVNHTGGVANVTAEKTNRRRRSILGGTVNLDTEKQEGVNPRSEEIKDRRQSLKASLSESTPARSTIPTRRQGVRTDSSSPTQRKKSISDSDVLAIGQTKKATDENGKFTNKSSACRKLERQRSARRTRSPGPLATKSPARPLGSLVEKTEEGRKNTWWNLSKSSDRKSSGRSANRRGSLASSTRDALEGGKSIDSGGQTRPTGTRSKSEDKLPEGVGVHHESLGIEVDLDLESGSRGSSDNQPGTNTLEQFHSSIDSLDIDLLTSSPSVHNKVTNVDQLFGVTDGKDIDLEDHDISSQSSSGSRGDEGVVSSSQARDPTRVSWVELPLFDPQQLLVKSADCDGANEVSELSSHVPSRRSLLSAFEVDNKEQHGKKKPNPSLKEAIDKDTADRKANGLQDEKTVVTASTNTSDATMKTTNKDPTQKKLAKKKSKREDMGSSQDSMTIDNLDTPVASAQGSSGSLSRSSRRSKCSSLGSKGSLGNNGSFSESSNGVGKTKARRLSRTACENDEKKEEISKRKGISAGSKLLRKRSSSLDEEAACATTLNYEGYLPLKKSTSLVSPGTLKKSSSLESPGTLKKSSSLVSPGTLKTPTLESPGSFKKTPTLESPGTLNRKRSYLNKRKIMKADIAESQIAKKAVNTSLDAFMKRIEGASPVVKDDNRSVYSSMQEGDRRRRSIQRDKNGEKMFSRRVSRINPRKSLENALDGLDGDGKIDNDADSMSITSAPVLRSRSRSISAKQQQLQDEFQKESQRPVVNLKKTQFSSKLTKLQVAF